MTTFTQIFAWYSSSNFTHQGSTCLEAGSYLLNYQGCAACKALGLLQEVERERQEDDNEETISFKREQAWTCVVMVKMDLCGASYSSKCLPWVTCYISA